MKNDPIVNWTKNIQLGKINGAFIDPYACRWVYTAIVCFASCNSFQLYRSSISITTIYQLCSTPPNCPYWRTEFIQFCIRPWRWMYHNASAIDSRHTRRMDCYRRFFNPQINFVLSSKLQKNPFCSLISLTAAIHIWTTNRTQNKKNPSATCHSFCGKNNDFYLNAGGKNTPRQNFSSPKHWLMIDGFSTDATATPYDTNLSMNFRGLVCHPGSIICVPLGKARTETGKLAGKGSSFSCNYATLTGVTNMVCAG